MTPERWQQIDALFQSTLAREISERAGFLDQECAGDENLRQEVEALLAAESEAGRFLNVPALEATAQSLAAQQAPDLVGKTVGHYGILKQLGAGGMGVVYLATDLRMNRKVALKLLPYYFNGNEQRVRRFQQEAKAVLALNHPNIVTIYEVGEAEKVNFIATELIEGETLRDRVDRRPVSVSDALDIALQIANALTAAHQAGIIHRDIKPENIMLRPDGYVKVLDFGIAKLNEQEATITITSTVIGANTNPGALLGTVNYMSPEQAGGSGVDARTDIWSLGVVLYEMLTGLLPFSGETPVARIAAILERQQAPLKQCAGDAPPELQWIVNKTLRKDREERYQTIRELSSDLRELKQEIDVQTRLNLSGTPQRAAVNIDPHSSAADANGKHSSLRAWPRARGDGSRVRPHPLLNLVAWKWIAAVVLVAGLLGAIALVKYMPASGKTINSVAVLPFINVGGDPNSEYLSDGITESLINGLSRLPHLTVIASNSVFRYKVRDPQSGVPDPQTVAHELKVQAVLIGRIIQRGDDLFVSAELVRAEDNSHIWGAQYNRKLADVFALQADIAKDISQELRLELTGEEKQDFGKRSTDNLKAFEYYMQGRAYIHRRTRDDLLLAASYYQKAIEADQNFALAYAGLAEVYGNLGVRGYIAPVDGRRKLEQAARKAVLLDDNLADAHVMLGYFHMGFVPYNFPEGDRELARAIELSPSLAIGHLYLALSLLRQDRIDDGLAEMQRARELDPFSSIIAHQVALCYFLGRDYPRALQILRQANETGGAFTTTSEVGIYTQNRLFDEALATIDRENRERKDDPLLIFDKGMVYAAQGRRAEALGVISELERLSGPDFSQAQFIARIHAVLNDKEQAFAWLERGLGTGTLGGFYKSEPTWDSLRGDPRFSDLLRRMGIPG